MGSLRQNTIYAFEIYKYLSAPYTSSHPVDNVVRNLRYHPVFVDKWPQEKFFYAARRFSRLHVTGGMF